jgi:hypothetical protein
MNEDLYLSEKIGAIKNEMSHIWGAIFVTGGGAITIAVTNFNILTLFLFIVGVVLSVMFLNAYFIRKQELIFNLDRLKEEK